MSSTRTSFAAASLALGRTSRLRRLAAALALALACASLAAAACAQAAFKPALDEAQLVQLMIGRQLEDYLPGSGARIGRGAGGATPAEGEAGASDARSEDYELLRVDALAHR